MIQTHLPADERAKRLADQVHRPNAKSIKHLAERPGEIMKLPFGHPRVSHLDQSNASP
jgi:hypothetical protein